MFLFCVHNDFYKSMKEDDHICFHDFFNKTTESNMIISILIIAFKSFAFISLMNMTYLIKFLNIIIIRFIS